LNDLTSLPFLFHTVRLLLAGGMAADCSRHIWLSITPFGKPVAEVPQQHSKRQPSYRSAFINQ
jgi:hypothetical protein